MWAIDLQVGFFFFLPLYFAYGDFDIHKFIYSHPTEVIYNQLVLLYFEYAFILIKTNSTQS